MMKEKTFTVRTENGTETRKYNDAIRVNCWHIIYGNPTYQIYMADGEKIRLVDNYEICRSYFPCGYTEVKRKKDL